MTKPPINQKEYLKKYLKSDKDDKKKKKKVKVGTKSVKIIDDDIDLSQIRMMNDDELEILGPSEDAPQIVGIIDERGPVDFADRKRWRIIADDGEGNVAIESRSRDAGRHSDNVSDKIHKNNQANGNIDTLPPKKSRTQSDDDLSSPRHMQGKKKSKRRRNKSTSSEASSDSSSDSEPDRKRRSKKSSKNHHDDSDLSPPRGNKSDSDMSPPRKSVKNLKKRNSRRNDDSDMSPPRKSFKNSEKSKNSRKNDDSDLSPPRKSKRDKSADSDHTPPRKSSKKSEKSRNSRRDDDSDLSPLRKSQGSRRDKSPDSDLSPPRKSSKNSEKSRNSRRNDDSDLSPPRKSKNSRRNESPDSDLSPPKKSRREEPRDSRRDRRPDSRRDDRRRDRNSDSDLSPPRRDSRRDRDDDRRRNNSRTDRFRPDSSRYHDKSRRKPSRWNEEERRRSRSPTPDRRMKKTLDGKTAGLQDAKALREETLSHKKREKELFSKMSADVSGEGQAAVLRDRKTGKRRDLAAEAAEKREKERQQAEVDEKYSKWGRGLKQVNDREEKLQDEAYEASKPLARYADDADLDARLRAVEHDSEDPMLAYLHEKQIAEGTRKREVPVSGPILPNRFGIKPGSRWDGVDRSNGYEKKWFEARNARKAVAEEAYKWSTADM